MARQNIEIEMVRGDASYKRALKRVAWYFDHPPKPGTVDDTEFGLLMLMCDRYESEHHTVPPPDPVATIEFALDQRGLTTVDLQRLLGSRQRVHDIMRRKRCLSLKHVRVLHDELGVPAEVLIQAY